MPPPIRKRPARTGRYLRITARSAAARWSLATRSWTHSATLPARGIPLSSYRRYKPRFPSSFHKEIPDFPRQKDRMDWMAPENHHQCLTRRQQRHQFLIRFRLYKYRARRYKRCLHNWPRRRKAAIPVDGHQIVVGRTNGEVTHPCAQHTAQHRTVVIDQLVSTTGTAIAHMLGIVHFTVFQGGIIGGTAATIVHQR